MTLKVGVIGAGGVGATLGNKIRQGSEVRYGVRNPAADKVKQVLDQQPGTSAFLTADVIEWADAIVLATPSLHTDDEIKELAASLGPGVKGKVIVDVTNPLSSYPGLEIRWDQGNSGGEVLQKYLPDAFVYKAFNSVGVEQLGAGDGSLINGTQLTMLFAGSSEKKDIAAEVVSLAGFIPEHVGSIRYSRNLEAIAELWIHLSGIPQVGTAANWGRNFHLQVIKKP